MLAKENLVSIDLDNDQLNAEGKIKIYKGKPELWRVLDKSFDSKIVQDLQENINDTKMVRIISKDEKELIEKKEKEMESDAEKDFIELPIKTKFSDSS